MSDYMCLSWYWNEVGTWIPCAFSLIMTFATLCIAKYFGGDTLSCAMIMTGIPVIPVYWLVLALIPIPLSAASLVILFLCVVVSKIPTRGV